MSAATPTRRTTRRANPVAVPPTQGDGPAFGDATGPVRLRTRVVAIAAVVVPAVTLRLLYLTSLGFNSDEAVYSGQGASLAGIPQYLPYFPVFRAHPLVFQTMLSFPHRWGLDPMAGRYLAALLGVGTIAVTYLIGKAMYGRRAGWVAALIMALMPYHVVVSRQVLLDGPQTFFATLTLYLLVRYVRTGQTNWLYAAGATFGLTFLSKETTVLLVGGVYAFFAITPSVAVKVRHLLGAAVVFFLVSAAYPISLIWADNEGTGESFLAWQLFRRPNHDWNFYLSQVPPSIGFGVCLAAVWAVVVYRRNRSWREILLLCWIAVPFGFFQMWPTKGFQYLVPIAPAVAVLAGYAITRFPDGLPQRWRGPLDGRDGTVRAVLVGLIAVSLAIPSLLLVLPHTADGEFLAGSGGVPGGREAGEWVGENLPEGSTLLALGPSMANIIQFYGDRKVFGLSVSPNPLHRNPVYEPVINPDNLLRTNELQYLVWDSFSASRSAFFSEKLLRFARRYNGRVIHTEFVESRASDGSLVDQPVVVIYEVRP